MEEEMEIDTTQCSDFNSFNLLQVLTTKVEEFKLKLNTNDDTGTGSSSSCDVTTLLHDLQLIIDEANKNLELNSELGDNRRGNALNGTKRLKMNNSSGDNPAVKNASILKDKNTQEQSSLDELANEDVLSLVFDYIGFQDLLNFRLVSPKWRQSSTSSLLKKNACQITLTRKYLSTPGIEPSPSLTSSSCEYVNNKVRDENHDPSSLRLLNILIQNSLKFPCKSFSFIDLTFDIEGLCLTSNSRGNSSSKMSAAMKMDSEIRKLFSLFGQEITSLSFSGTLFQSDLRHILIHRAPNLEILDLSALENLVSSRSKNLFPGGDINLRLTTLRLGSPFFLDQDQNEKTLRELVEAAPNLRGIYNVRMWCLKPIVQANKVHLIKDLDFDPGADPDEIELIQRFAIGEPKLTRLSVNFTYVSSIKRFWPCVVQVLSSVLNSSKDTLEFLEVHPLGKMKLVQEPLTKCRVLRIGDDYGHYGYGGGDAPDPEDEDSDESGGEGVNGDGGGIVPPQCVSFAHNFPEIETIQLDLQYLDEDSINFYFPVIQSSHSQSLTPVPAPMTSSSVKNLEIYNDWPDYLCTRILSKRFPQLTTLKLACYHASDLSESIWQWQSCQHLESIEIYGVSNGGVGEPVGVSSSVIDSFFTGIPVDTCRELKMKRFEKTTAEGDIDLLRVKSSICDMKHLRKFKIVFMELRAPFISHVSGFYAFQLMPQLEITFAYDKSKLFSKVAKETEKYLEAVAPFVNLVHHRKPTPFSRTLE